MKTREEMEKKWKKEGFSCDLWIDPPGQRWEGFTHETDEVVCMLKGKIELEMNGKIQTLESGDEAFIPARAQHSVRNVGTTESRWLYGYRQR